MPETRHTFYSCIFFKFNIQCESAIIETGLRRDVQPGELHNLQGCTELQKSINYLTFSGTTVSTSIRFPRSSLPRLVNLVHAAVPRYSSVVLNLVLEC